MEFRMQSGGLPVGSYRAEFIGVEPYRENIEKYGEGVSLKWRVLEGQHANSEVTRICSMKLTPKTALGKFAVAIKGGAIETGERFTFTSYIGVRGSLLVEATDNGGSRVSVFLCSRNGLRCWWISLSLLNESVFFPPICTLCSDS